jgi:hypothetical protein
MMHGQKTIKLDLGCQSITLYPVGHVTAGIGKGTGQNLETMTATSIHQDQKFLAYYGNAWE